MWWTNGRHDDVFWRTAGSGARATTRHKRNRRTRNAYGDICATDHVGAPLLDVAIISLKTGYRETHASGLLDKPNKKKKYELEKWIKEAKDCWKQSGSFSWVIIHNRKGRAAVVYIPETLFKVLAKHAQRHSMGPGLMYATRKGKAFYFVVMRLEDFLAIPPKVFMAISEVC